jgi:hypothetical protein
VCTPLAATLACVLSVTLDRAIAWAGIAGAAIAALALALHVLHRRRERGRAQRASRRNAAADTERRGLLAAAPAIFSAKAWPPFGAPGRPKQVPLALWVHGSPVWIREVRLSFGRRDSGP